MRDYKRLPFEGLRNCRDLGGYACDDGKMIRYHVLYRAEAPTELSGRDWERMREAGVRTIIDLRSMSEQKLNPYEAPDWAERISYPLQQNDIPVTMPETMSREQMKEAAAHAFGKSLADGYTKMIEDAPERMVFLLNTIAKALARGAVLYHCTAGKDRTGVLSAILYLLCGVEEADIVADYQVSAVYQKENPLFELVPEEMKSFLKSDPETMKFFLKEAQEKDYISLLKENGLTAEIIQSIREKIMEE